MKCKKRGCTNKAKRKGYCANCLFTPKQMQAVAQYYREKQEFAHYDALERAGKLATS